MLREDTFFEEFDDKNARGSYAGSLILFPVLLVHSSIEIANSFSTLLLYRLLYVQKDLIFPSGVA